MGSKQSSAIAQTTEITYAQPSEITAPKYKPELFGYINPDILVESGLINFFAAERTIVDYLNRMPQKKSEFYESVMKKYLNNIRSIATRALSEYKYGNKLLALSKNPNIMSRADANALNRLIASRFKAAKALYAKYSNRLLVNKDLYVQYFFSDAQKDENYYDEYVFTVNMHEKYSPLIEEILLRALSLVNYIAAARKKRTGGQPDERQQTSLSGQQTNQSESSISFIAEMLNSPVNLMILFAIFIVIILIIIIIWQQNNVSGGVRGNKDIY